MPGRHPSGGYLQKLINEKTLTAKPGGVGSNGISLGKCNLNLQFKSLIYKLSYFYFFD